MKAFLRAKSGAHTSPPAWYMKAKYCRISGLPVHAPRTLFSAKPDSRYRAEFAKLGDRILLTKGFGYVSADEMAEAIEFAEKYRRTHFVSAKNLILIEDYGAVSGADPLARKQYVDYYHNNQNFIGGIAYDIAPLFKISAKLGRRLYFHDKAIFIVDFYSQAIAVAQEMIARMDSAGSVPSASELQQLPVPGRFPASASAGDRLKSMSRLVNQMFRPAWLYMARRFNTVFARHYTEALLDYIETIDWQKDGGRLPAARGYPDPSMKKAFDAIGYIKFEIDRLINERVSAEAELREREARYRQLVEHARAGILELDLNSFSFTHYNESVLEMTGYTGPEFRSLKVEALLSRESHAVFKARLEALRKGAPFSPDVIYQVMRKNGELRWVLLNTHVVYAGGQPERACMVVSDITELKRIEEWCLSYQEKLKSLTIQLSKTQETERRELASRLHDGVSQELFVAHLQLNSMEKKLAQQDAAHAREIGRIKEQVQKLIRETRTLTFDLSPPVLYDFGLKEAIEYLADTVEKKHDIAIRARFSGNMDALGDDIKIIVYRNISELIHNTIKHSGAGRIWLLLINAEDWLRVDFQDDGVGFSMEAQQTGGCDGGHGGFGFFDIREKLNHLGGYLSVDSSAGQGVSIRMELPLERASSEAGAL